jgi:hypothetical protein
MFRFLAVRFGSLKHDSLHHYYCRRHRRRRHCRRRLLDHHYYMACLAHLSAQ